MCKVDSVVVLCRMWRERDGVGEESATRRDGRSSGYIIYSGGCIYLNDCHCRVAAQGAPRAWLRTVRVRRFAGGVGRAGRGRGVP